MKTLTTTYRQLPYITSVSGHLGSLTASNKLGVFRIDYFNNHEPKFFIQGVRSMVIMPKLYAFFSARAKGLGWVL